MLVSWYAAPPSKWRLLHDLLATDSIRFPWSLCLSRGPLTFPSVRHCRFGVLWVMWTCDNVSASSVTMKAWPFTWDALGQWILWIRWHLERFYPQGGCGGSSLGSNFLVIDAIKDERWHFAYCKSLVFWCFGFFCWGGGFSRNLPHEKVLSCWENRGDTQYSGPTRHDLFCMSWLTSGYCHEDSHPVVELRWAPVWSFILY